MTVSLYFLAATVAGAVVVSACATAARPVASTPVEFFRRGDDALTIHFAEALEASFRASGRFVEASGTEPRALIVTISNHLQWRRVGSRTRATYSVVLADRTGQVLGTSTGSCWDDELSQCADRVLKDATTAARKLK
jgi:hypothetical protein